MTTPSIGASASSSPSLGTGTPRSSGVASVPVSPASGGAGPALGVGVGRRVRIGERRRLEVARQPRCTPAPPAVEDRVVDLPVVTPAGEDRGPGAPDLLAVADVDQRSGHGRSPTAAPRSTASLAARNARPKPDRLAQQPAPVDLGAERLADDGGIGHRSLRSAAGGGLGQHASGLVAPDLADVLLVLEDDAERLVDQLRCQLASPRATGAPPPSRASRRCPAPWSGRPRAGDGRSRRPRARGAPAPRGPARARSRTPSARSGSRSSGTGSGA